MSLRIAAASFVLILVGSGCQEHDLPEPWRITYPRVLAMRAEVPSDESRATPEPGERVRLRVLIVGPEPLQRLSYTLDACAALPASGELPGCASEPFTSLAASVERAEELSTSELSIELDVPNRADLHGAERLLVNGTICTEGEARSDREHIGAGSCTHGNQPPVTWAGHIVVALTADQRNANPELGSASISFDEQLWPPDAPEQATAPITIERDDGAHEIRVDLEDSGRERAMGRPEELLLSHFVTSGTLERRFSVLEQDQPDHLPVTLEWRGPDSAASEGPEAERVTAAFVLRDQRGGVAFARRTLVLR